MPRLTRQRILDTARNMFNTLGESSVTTNSIAQELGISPGNLYYHFRSKDDIIEHLFVSLDERMNEAREMPKDRPATLEDIWLQLHGVFACIWEYRFIYRNLPEILRRNRSLRVRYARTLERVDKNAHRILNELRLAGRLSATPEELDAVITNILVIATSWLNYVVVLGEEDEKTAVHKGIAQVMIQLVPFLPELERQHLRKLTQ